MALFWIAGVYFMTLLAAVKWMSNGSQQAPLHSKWGNYFLSFSLFSFCERIKPPPRPLKAASLPDGPSVVFICSSTSLWFSSFRILFMPDWAPALLKKTMKGSCKVLWKEIFYLDDVLCLLYHSLSAHSSRTEEWEETDKLTPVHRFCFPRLMTASVCCVEPPCAKCETDK